MSISSIGRLIAVLLIFSSLNTVFSPSLAENLFILDRNSFIEAGPIVKQIVYFRITGYSSTPEETDDTPWITAYNTPARENIVASNDLPFGTKIRIPSLFGDRIFIVEDRLNERFKNVIDVWFPTKEEALNFGAHDNVLVEILE